MPFFSETAAAAASGRNVRAAWLVHLGFTSGSKRVWIGHGTLVAGGQQWSGLGELGSISGIELPLNGTAPVTTLTLSGVDPSLVGTALAASDEVKRRPAQIYLQFFDEDWQTLDNPYALLIGTMDRMSISGEGAETRTVEVTVEWLFTRRGAPPFAYLSDRDQKALYPGDRGLEQMAAMQSKSVEWPSF